MQKTLLTILILAIAPVTHAASFDVSPNPIVTSAHFGNTPSGAFTDNWRLTVGPNIGGAVGVLSVSFKDINIQNLSAVLDGTIVLVSQQFDNLTQLSAQFNPLSVGDHELVVSGFSNGGSYAGNIDVAPVSAVPLPATVWLFAGGLAVLRRFIGGKKCN